MKRLLRWLGIAIGAVLGLIVVALGVIYVLSQLKLRQRYPLPQTAIVVPGDATSIAEGQRLATIAGCYNSCHGRQGEGAVLFDEPIIGRLIAPNLTASVRTYSDAELVNIIKYGLRPDGHSVFVMPAEAFNHLSDADLGRIIAFLRSLPARPGPAAGGFLGPLGRLGVVMGQFKMAAQLIAETSPLPQAASPDAVTGRYIAQSVCAHCHATDLRGRSTPAYTSPNLQIVSAYSADAFTRLLRTGVPLGGQKLGMMREEAQMNLHLLTDAEIASLYAYLHALPDPQHHADPR
jgi:mono/diheme cytochrome c family protein